MKWIIEVKDIESFIDKEKGNNCKYYYSYYKSLVKNI